MATKREKMKEMKDAGKVAYTGDDGKEIRFCLCGCAEPMITASKKTLFRPGHDARMVRVVRRELKEEIILNPLQNAYVEWRELRPYVQARLDKEARAEAEKLARKEAQDKARADKKAEREAKKAAKAEAVPA